MNVIIKLKQHAQHHGLAQGKEYKATKHSDCYFAVGDVSKAIPLDDAIEVDCV